MRTAVREPYAIVDKRAGSSSGGSSPDPEPHEQIGSAVTVIPGASGLGAAATRSEV